MACSTARTKKNNARGEFCQRAIGGVNKSVATIARANPDATMRRSDGSYLPIDQRHRRERTRRHMRSAWVAEFASERTRATDAFPRRELRMPATKTINWPLTGLFVLITSVTVVGIFLPPDDRICSATLLGQSAKEANTLVFGCKEFWLNRYQTLIAAILALAAAAVSVYFLRRQIAQADVHEQERYKRQHAAARAVLQLTLTDICDYAKKSALAFHGVLEAIGNDGRVLRPIPFDPPPVPEQPIEQLRDFIASTDAHRSAIVSELIKEIQVHSARSKTDAVNIRAPEQGDALVPKVQIVEYLVDAAEIYARASMLFDYARRRSEQFPSVPKQADISAALFNIRFGLTDEPAIRELIERRYPVD